MEIKREEVRMTEKIKIGKKEREEGRRRLKE